MRAACCGARIRRSVPAWGAGAPRVRLRYAGRLPCSASTGSGPSSMRASARLRRLLGRLLQQVYRGVELSIKVPAEDFQDLDQGPIADRIIDLVTHLPADHDLFGPEHG